VSEQAGAHDEERRDPPVRLEHVQRHVACQEQVAILARANHVLELRADADAGRQVDPHRPAEHPVVDRRIVHESGVADGELHGR
jgi:hypothetical protein